MEGSNNPEGTAHVTDDVLISALRESLAEDDETLAVPASSVSEELPIKQQAVKKRLNRLEKEDSPVRRYRGAQAWHYYTAESLAQMADAEPATADGMGIGMAYLSLPVGGLYHVGKLFAFIFGLGAIGLASASLWVPGLNGVAIVSLGVSVLGLYTMVAYKDAADPSFDWKDWERPLEGAKQMKRGSDDE